MSKKNLISVAAVSSIAIGLLCCTAHAEEPVKVYVNGEMVSFTDSQPYIELNRTLAPTDPNGHTSDMETAFAKLGWTTEWDDQRYSVTIFNERSDPSTQLERTIDVHDGSVTYGICDPKEGEESGYCQIFSDVNPKLVGDTLMLPLRLVMQLTGSNVSWDENTRSIYIGGEKSDEVMMTQNFMDFIGSLDGGQADNYALDINNDGKFECVVFHPLNDSTGEVLVYTTDSNGNIITEPTLRATYPYESTRSFNNAQELIAFLNSVGI